MKKKEIKAALDALKALRMPKIENKDLRNTLIANHLKLIGESRKLEQKRQDLEEVHLGPFREQRERIGELQQKLQQETDREKQAAIIAEINSHADLFAAAKAYESDLTKIGEESVEGITPIESNDLIAALDGQNDIPASFLEDIYPMLNIDNE